MRRSSVGRRWRPQKNLADPSQPTSPGVRSSARFSAPLSPGTPCGRRFPHVLTPRCGHASAPLLGELLPPPLLQPRARGISPARCDLLTWFVIVRHRSTRGWRRGAGAVEAARPLQIAPYPLLHRRVSTNAQSNELAQRHSVKPNFYSSLSQ